MKKVIIVTSLITFIIASNTPRLDNLEKNYNYLNKNLIQQNAMLKKIENDIKFNNKKLNLYEQKMINKDLLNFYKENQNEQFNFLNQRISDINFYIALYAIIITLIIVVFTLITYINIKNRVKEQVNEWINNESNKEITNKLEPTINDIRKTKARINDIEYNLSRSYDRIYRKEKKINNIEDIYRNDVDDSQIDNIKLKKEKDMNINDYIKLSENSLKLIKPNESIYFLYKALEKANSKKEKEIIYNLLGYSYEFIDNYDKAIKYYNMALDINKKNLNTKYNKALCEYNFGNLEKAETLFNDIIREDSNHYQSYKQLSNIYSDQKNYNKALNYINKAIDIKEDFYEAYYNKGFIHDELKEYEKAIQSYKQAIDINPDDENSYLNLFELEIRYPKEIQKVKLDINKLKNAFVERFKQKLYIYIKYEMLEIINNIKNNKDYNIEDWKRKYYNTYIHNWSFKDLEEWNNNNKGAIKDKISHVLTVFKEHAPNPYTSLQQYVF